MVTFARARHRGNRNGAFDGAQPRELRRTVQSSVRYAGSFALRNDESFTMFFSSRAKLGAW